jgi:hypothetical protein
LQRTGAQQAACTRHDEGRSSTLAGDIADSKTQEAGSYLEYIVKVTADLERRFDHGVNVNHRGIDRIFGRQHRALVKPGFGQFALKTGKLRPIFGAQHLLFEHRAHARSQQRRVEWLWQIVFRAKFNASHHGVEFRGRRNHHDRGFFKPPLVLHHLEHLDAVHARHHHIEEDEIERFGTDAIQRLQPVGGLCDLCQVQALEAACKHVTIVGIVVDDEDTGS